MITTVKNWILFFVLSLFIKNENYLKRKILTQLQKSLYYELYHEERMHSSIKIAQKINRSFKGRVISRFDLESLLTHYNGFISSEELRKNLYLIRDAIIAKRHF